VRIAALTAAVAVIAGLKSRISLLESAPPQVVEKIVEKLVEKPDAAIDLAAAKSAGFALKGADDLEIIEGIGPKIAELLHAKGVKTFAQLAAMTPAQIQPMLDEAGPNFRLANPETWPDQADLAARNRWASLKAMQDGLLAGNRKA
jgi:predicted flap endonuclease-1-like 5' DNA nuclease